MIQFVGVQVKCLSPYSPNLFSIELCWSKIEVILGSEAAQTSNVLDEAITKALNAITDENALNCFHHSGLFLEPNT
ncbi:MULTISPECIES: hypothetical protein [unclassified Microcoleus]|uniref:hypothetical protein n=1 Tax=unclassified Microcoleus TaxID=2642155 RepID=UPI002FD0AC4D